MSVFKIDRTKHQLVLIADGLPIDASTENTPAQYFEFIRQADNLVMIWHATLELTGCPTHHRIITERPDIRTYQAEITWTVPTESSNNSTIYTVCPISQVDHYLRPDLRPEITGKA